MTLSALARRLFGSSRRENAATGTSGAELTAAGIAHLERGEAAAARDAFEQAIAAEPFRADRHVNLAYAHQLLGDETAAQVHLKRALELDPDSFDARYMLAGILEGTRDFAGAGVQLAAATRLRPDFLDAWVDLARVSAAAGDFAAARAAIARGRAIGPDDPRLHMYMGNLAMEDGKPEPAEASYREALKGLVGSPEVLGNLSRALLAQKRVDEALDCLDRALAAAPDALPLLVQRGIALKAAGRLDESATVLARALAIDADHAEAINTLGTVHAERGRLDEAIALYRRAILLRPELPGGYGNLGLALYQRGDVSEAVVVYRQGLAIKPVAEIHDNLAIALQKQGVVDEAIEHYHRALALQPDNVNTRCNLAAALVEGGGPQDAIRAYREILSYKPDHLIAHSNLLFNLSVDPATSVEDYLAEARRFDAKLQRTPLRPATPDENAGTGRPLRVGFVSADLRAHPVGYFLEGILRAMDPLRFALYGYPTIAQTDELTARIRPLFSGWRQLKGLDDETAARAIRADGVDILIDLSGHTADNRLPMFAWKPAPVQATWLGYFASTGVSSIDIVLADPLCVPPGAEGQFTESVWRLPDTRLCFTPPAEGSVPAVAPLPAATRGHLTFGCFQRLPKLTDAVLALWGQVFSAVPDARLLLQSHQTGRALYANQILDRLAQAGIARERVTIRGPAHRSVYLQSYGDIDIVLDTFPYTGGTTTCEALWMGVPTITLTGATMIARQGLAMMTAAGLPEWVARDANDYVSIAGRWAGDHRGLAALRADLRSRLPSTPLFDPRRFAGAFQDTLEAVWHRTLAQARSTTV